MSGRSGAGAGVQCGACGVTCNEGCVGGGCGTGGGGGAGCGVAACGCEADTNTVVSYVGWGQGEYVAETSFKYVGQGAGDIQFVEVGAAGCGWWKWLLTLPLIVLIIWFGYGNMSQETTSTTPAPDGIPKTCLVYGDPHVLSFDSAHGDYYSAGEYWIVKSDTVWIQGKYEPTPMTNGLAVTKQIAIGGPFLKGHHLVVDSLSTTTWYTGTSGQPILTGFPSSFHSADPFVDIQYNSQGKLLQKGRDGKPLHVLHITMPRGVKIQINRWNEVGEGDYMNVEITMPPQPLQDGQCGTPNGNAEDDDRIEVRKRLGTQGVAVGDLLFEGPKTPIVTANRPDISNCPSPTLTMAKDLCKKKEGKFFPSKQCLIDVCFGGKQFAAEEAGI